MSKDQLQRLPKKPKANPEEAVEQAGKQRAQVLHEDRKLGSTYAPLDTLIQSVDLIPVSMRDDSSAVLPGSAPLIIGSVPGEVLTPAAAAVQQQVDDSYDPADNQPDSPTNKPATMAVSVWAEPL